MGKYTEIIKKATRNKVLHYIFSRYATYLIQFINSLFIAVYLGPYYLGIWGFITLIIQYLNQLNLGIAHSVNAIIAIHKNKEWYAKKIIGTSITMLIGLSIIIGSFFAANEIFNLDLGSKYNFSVYAPVVALIGILSYFNTWFSVIFRVYGRVTEIALNQSAFPVLMLITILLFKGEKLLWALVIANLLAFSLSFFVYLFKTPVKFKPIFIGRLIKTIQIKGWHLFVYNTSFYFIIISTRSFVSAYYTVEEFGYFTFAFSLANVALLLLQSFSFLITPKLINRLANATNEKAIELLNQVKDVYITTSHLLIHVAILIFPLFLLFFPQYSQSENAFKLIVLSVILYTNSFGYSGFLIAKNYGKKLGIISFISLVINIICAFILIKIFHVNFSYVIITTMVSYFIYILLLGRLSRKYLKLDTNVIQIFKDVFPVRLLIPYLISMVIIISSPSNLYFIIPMLIFLKMNYKSLIKLKQIARNILINPVLIDV